MIMMIIMKGRTFLHHFSKLVYKVLYEAKTIEHNDT